MLIRSKKSTLYVSGCRTSSLLDCFALLALRVDIPSLAAVLGVDSSFGLGIAEGLSVWKGFGALFFGVPR